MAIGAAEHNMFGLVHRFDGLMALQAAKAFGIRFGLRLVDPVAGRKSGTVEGARDRCGSGGSVAGHRRILGD